MNTSISGWNYCVPTIIIYGNFIKSTYQGTMLCASVIDVTNEFNDLFLDKIV